MPCRTYPFLRLPTTHQSASQTATRTCQKNTVCTPFFDSHLATFFFFFWLSHFLCHVACGYICFSISICQSFRCFSCSFTKLELTVLCDTVQFSSVRYGFGFGSVPLWTYVRWLDCECCHVEIMNVNAPRQLQQQQQQQQSHVTHHNHKANIIIIIIIIIAISIIIIIIVTVIVVRF